MSEIVTKNVACGHDLVPSVIYQVLGMDESWMVNDEIVYYSFDAGTYIGDDTQEHAILPSTISFSATAKKTCSNVSAFDAGCSVTATVSVSAKLKELYPLAIVTIDGVDHDLAILDNGIQLYMDQDHRITINWIHGSKVEVFRILAVR